MIYHVTIAETVESVITVYDCANESEARNRVIHGDYNDEDQTDRTSDIGAITIIDVVESEEVS
jgi:predicted amidohydrolase YtcJ